MRATSLFLLAVLVLACQAQPGSAQATPPDKQAAPSTPSKSDDVLSPSTLPKDRQKVTETTGTNGVDALSPDEARRAARARARAAAKGGPAHTATETPVPSPAPAQVPAAKAPDAPKAVAAAPAAPAAGTMIRKRVRAAEATSERSAPAPKHASLTPAHPARHASHPVAAYPGRAFAESDGRYGRQRALPRRASGPDRAPRVGDVIPAGVPLYPVPPSDDPRQAYAPGPPPFPGMRDEDADDGRGPRRVFGQPY